MRPNSTLPTTWSSSFRPTPVAGCPFSDTRLRTGVCGRREAERMLVEEGRLLGVSDPELHVIPAFERHEVVRAHVSDLRAFGGEAGCGEASSPTTVSSSNPCRSGAS